MLTENLEKPLSIEGLNQRIRSLIEGDIPPLWVQGEISNFKAHTSGHFYFSLKDAKSQIRAVMFRGHNSRLKFRPADGLQVLVHGKVSVFEPRGEYQITADMMEPVGAGALQKAFEDLKVKLRTEGLFASERKKKLPQNPKKIAIVTSPTGAAIRDMLNVFRRRSPYLEVLIIPTLVQGSAAVPQILNALKVAYQIQKLDGIIVARGGGSIEDMWCFNDESVARLIAESSVPIVSGIGHEIDFTITDFVADLRAPTPSAAAEMIAPAIDSMSTEVRQLDHRLINRLNSLIVFYKQKLQMTSARLVSPERRLRDLVQKNDLWISRLINAMESKLQYQKLVLQKKMALLDTLSPLRTVDRGYAIVSNQQGIVVSVGQLKNEEDLTIRLRDGNIVAKCVKIERKPHGV